MKRTMTVVLALITMMTIVAFAVPALANEYEPCGNVHEADLIADGGDTSTVVGTVTVSNNETQVCVEIDIEESGWWITETHIVVAETLAGIPTNTKGTSAVPGDFAYEQYYDISVEQTHAEYCVVLEDIDDGVEAGDTFVVAAHAVVARVICKKDGKACKVGSEGAWAAGTPFHEERGWDTYIGGLQVQQCGWPGCPLNEELIEWFQAYGETLAHYSKYVSGTYITVQTAQCDGCAYPGAHTYYNSQVTPTSSHVSINYPQGTPGPSVENITYDQAIACVEEMDALHEMYPYVPE